MRRVAWLVGAIVLAFPVGALARTPDLDSAPGSAARRARHTVAQRAPVAPKKKKKKKTTPPPVEDLPPDGLEDALTPADNFADRGTDKSGRGQKNPDTPTTTVHEDDGTRDDPIGRALHGEKAPTLREVDEPRAPVDTRPPGNRLFIGAHYGLTILPAFVTAAFARGPSTMLFHRLGAHLEVDRPKLSFVFSLDYIDLSSGAQLLGDRNSARTGNYGETFNDVGYFAYVESQLKAVSASADFLWGFPAMKDVRFEAGFGVGVGYVFGELYNNWVHESPNGPLSYDGRKFSPCRTVFDGPGCRPQDHASPLPIKVVSAGAPYAEKNWFDGGSKPVILPHVAPTVGLRWAATPDLAVRLGLGASLIGFFLRIDGSYGLPVAKPTTP